MTQQKTKLAQDLNKGDDFFHNELSSWKVIEQPIINQSLLTINVKAKHSTSNKVKVFNFGKNVRIDLK